MQKEEALMIDHFDGRGIFGLSEDEKNAVLQKSPRILTDVLVYYNFTKSNNIDQLSVIKIGGIHNIPKSKTQFEIRKGKYWTMDNYSRAYAPDPDNKTAKTFVLDFNLCILKNDQPDAKGEWMFVYPNQIRNVLKLDLVYP